MKRTRRDFVLGSMAAAAAGLAGGRASRAAGPQESRPSSPPTPSAGLASPPAGSAALLRSDPAHPRPAAFNRLDQSWHRAAVKRLQSRLKEERVDGALLAEIGRAHV